jgi:hypothetical protein
LKNLQRHVTVFAVFKKDPTISQAFVDFFVWKPELVTSFVPVRFLSILLWYWPLPNLSLERRLVAA